MYPAELDKQEILTPVLRCLECEATSLSLVDDSLVCTNCAQKYPFQDGILKISRTERAEVLAERKTAQDTESKPELGGINAQFDDLSEAKGELREAILSLPFGNGSKFYTEEGYFRNVHSHLPAFQFIDQHLGVFSGARLLDLGADLTWSTQHFAKKGAVCIALDINHHLKVARVFCEQFGVNYGLVNCDMHEQIFADQSFDFVTAFAALHHSGRLQELAYNLSRLLKPGGKLAISEPYCLSDSDKQSFGKAQIEVGINEHVYTLDEWHSSFVNAGLTVECFLLGTRFCAIFRKERKTSGTIDADLFSGFYHGEITEVECEKKRFCPEEEFKLNVLLSNTGPANWLSEGPTPVNLSYHLYRKNFLGRKVSFSFDNPRLTFEPYVRSNEERPLQLNVSAPIKPGKYLLEVDLVREGVTWFKEQGFRVKTFCFEVR